MTVEYNERELFEKLNAVEMELENGYDEYLELAGEEEYIEEREFLLQRASYLSKRLKMKAQG